MKDESCYHLSGGYFWEASERRIKPPLPVNLKEACPHLGFSISPGSLFLPPQVCNLGPRFH